MATIGSSIASPPAVLTNTANAITQKYFMPILADSIFKPSPTWWRITRMGKKLDGGGAIVWPIISQEETTGGAYTGAQVLDISPSDSLQPGELQWRFYQEAITIPVTDTLLNAGSGRVVDLVMAKNEIAMGSLLQKLSRGVYGVAPQNTSIDLDGVPTALAASGTYAGITLGGFWLCNGGSGPSSGSALSLANMMSDYGSATFGNEEPDTIVTTQAGWNAYWNTLIGNQRYQKDEETTRAGFRHLMFNSATVLHDQFVPAGEMEFFTSKYLKAVFHQNDYFSVDPFIQPTNQRVLSSHIWTTMNLQFVTLRQHARRTGITNA